MCVCGTFPFTALVTFTGHLRLKREKHCDMMMSSNGDSVCPQGKSCAIKVLKCYSSHACWTDQRFSADEVITGGQNEPKGRQWDMSF